MLDTNAKYVYEVYRCRSVSEAAKNLFISQPALSAAIRKAESELGAPIFNRKTLPFSLTDEGKIYIRAIEQILQIHGSAIDHIRDIRHSRGGTLKIATSTHLSFYAIPKILERFHKQNPQVDVNIILTDTDKLYDHLEKNLADLAFISTDTVPEGYHAVTLLNQTFVVVMPKGFPGSEHLLPFCLSHDQVISGDYDRSKRIRDMHLFSGIEFIYSAPDSAIYKKRRNLFGKSDMTPYITASSGRQQLNYNLMRSGFGAFLTTDANIATMPASPDCLYFVLDDPAARQDFSIVCPAAEEERPVVQDFIGDAIALFHRLHPLEQLKP